MVTGNIASITALLGILIPMVLGLAQVSFFRKRVDLLQPIAYIWLYWFLLYVIGPLLLYILPFDSIPYIRRMSQDNVYGYVFRIGILSSACFIVLNIGYFLSFPNITRVANLRNQRERSKSSLRYKPNMLNVFAPVAMLSALGILGLWYFRSILVQLMVNPDLRNDLTVGSGYAFSMILAFMVIPMIWMALSGGRPKWRLYWPLSLLCVCVLGVFGGRAEIAELVLGTVLVYAITRNISSEALTKIILSTGISLLCFSIIFLVFRVLRAELLSNQFETDAVISTVLFSIRGIVKPYENYIGFVDTIGRSPDFRVFELVQQQFMIFLPSQYFVKTNPSKILFAVLYGPFRSQSGLPFTFIGLLEYAGGIPVALIGSYLFGLLLKSAYIILLDKSKNAFVVVMYSYFIARLFIISWGVFTASNHLVIVGILLSGTLLLSRVVLAPITMFPSQNYELGSLTTSRGRAITRL